jgi:hypothetical protein
MELRGVDSRLILKWLLKVVGVSVWSGFIWLRLRFIGGLF